MKVILVWLLIGAISGWLAGVLVSGGGFGIFGNIVVGILGSIVADYVLPALGVHVGSGLAAHIFNGAVGGILVLFLLSFVKKK